MIRTLYQLFLFYYESDEVFEISYFSRFLVRGTAKEIGEKYSWTTMQRYDILSIQPKKGVTKVTVR